MSDPGDQPGILLLWSDPKERRSLFKILCATGLNVKFSQLSIEEIPQNNSLRLIVVDYDSMGAEASATLQATQSWDHRPQILVVSSFAERERLVELLELEFLTNFLGKNQEVDAHELFVTVQKLLKRDIFGLEKYLTWGARTQAFAVRHSGDKGTVLGSLGQYLELIGCNRRLSELAKTTLDELVMNAVYNAPVDMDGVPKYASRSRAVPVDLGDNEVVRVSFACDGKTLAVSAADNFGRLKRETVLGYVRKGLRRESDQIDEKQGGAGLGLFYIYESMNHLIVNVSPGKRTELIGLLDISGSYKDFAQQPKSLNLFVEDQL